MHYHEHQQIKYSRRWYELLVFLALVGIVPIVALISLLKIFSSLEIVTLSLLPLGVLGYWTYITHLQLNIKIDRHELRYQVPPSFDEWKNIPKRDIISFQIEPSERLKKLYPIPEVTWMGKHKKFILSGKFTLTLILKNNRKLTLSTSQPQLLKEAMNQLMKY